MQRLYLRALDSFESKPTYSGSVGAWTPNYSVSADGKRFLMLKTAERSQAKALTNINVVLNWFEELKRKVPAK